MRQIKFCNKCGKELDELDLDADYSLNKCIEYGSKYDLSIIHMQFCADCLDALIGECKRSPIVGEYGLTCPSNYFCNND